MPRTVPSSRVRGRDARQADMTAVKLSSSKVDKKKAKKEDTEVKMVDPGATPPDLSDLRSFPKLGTGDHCGVCDKEVMENQQGLKCDCCETWFHSKCEKTSDDVYQFLCDHDEERSLCWYCKRCTGVVRTVLMSVAKLEAAQKRVEDKVDRILDVLDEKQNGEWSTVVERNQKQLDEKVETLMNIVEEKTFDPVRMHDCVEGAVRSQLQEDKDEEEEIRKRKTSVIVNGVKEPTAESPEDRKSEDEEVIEDLLQKLRADDVSVNKVIRLGKRPGESEAKPRPVKLELASEEQKEKVLQRAKNILREEEGAYKQIFIHQDLTPNQRKKRRELVQEMKERQSKGETNLVIANWKIVTRRSRQVRQTQN